MVHLRRAAYAQIQVRKYRQLTSKDARRHVYPNRRSPYVPLTARTRIIYHWTD